MSRLKFSVFFVLAVAAMVLAAPQGGKVRSVFGDVSYQKKDKATWLALRVGAKVQDGDVIQTNVESTVTIGLPDGSMISIEENALVVFNQVQYEKSSLISDVIIKKGMLRFDAQKQVSSKSSFKFSTGTATASIRGTDGTVGLTEAGQPYGALNSGSMVMENNGQEVSVKPNQFVAFRKDQAPIVVEAKNASDPEFAKNIGAMVDDTTQSVESIKAQAKEMDRQIEQRNEDLRSKYNCVIDSIPALVSSQSVEIGVTCTEGMSVSIGSETMVSSGEKMTFTPSWSKSAFGDKKFVVSCSVDGKIFECGRIGFTYRIDRAVSFHGYDESKCFANFKTSGFDENEGTLSVVVDKKEVSKMVLDKDTVGRIDLVPGTHTYQLIPQNVEPSMGVATNDLGCYPETEVAVRIRGDKTEVIKKRVSQGAFRYEDMEFDILNVPGNDRRQVEYIVVTMGSQRFEIAPIDSKFIGYRAKLKIPRGKSRTIKVTVVMRNGRTVSDTKTYVFR